MNIEQLKLCIEGRTITYPQVWVLQDESSRFIADQYIHEIADSYNYNIVRVDSLNEVKYSGFLDDNDDLYVWVTDVIEDFRPMDKCIIICNKSTYKDAVIIPKLEHWQFVDYLTTIVPGVNKSDIEWLITQYEQTMSRKTYTNYYRMKNDLDKLAIFDESLQDSLFNEFYNAGEYNTTSNLTIFDLTNAIIKRDVKAALEVLKVIDYIDASPPVWLLTILQNNFANIIAIQIGNRTAKDLGMSDKQYYVVSKYNCGYYTAKELIKINKVLTHAEYMYKFGGITMSNLFYYLIINILGV